MSFASKLLEYYSKELHSLKTYGAFFSKKFPAIAKRLGFVNGHTEDPHVERLIESVAFLTSKLHKRMDDDLSEMNKAILETLMPHFLRLVPAVTIVQFCVNTDRASLQHSLQVDRHTELHARAVEGFENRFRTCYPLTILPIELTEAALANDNESSLVLKLLSSAKKLHDEASLRICITGQNEFKFLLYEALLSKVISLTYKNSKKQFNYRQLDIQTVGFSGQDCLCPEDMHIDTIHNTLRDYAVFAEKFLFVNLPLPKDLFTNYPDEVVELRFDFQPGMTTSRLKALGNQINTDNIRLNCVPVVNIFQQISEPIIPNATEGEFLLKPDVRDSDNYAIYAVKEVKLKRKQGQRTNEFQLSPLFGIRMYDEDSVVGGLWQFHQKMILKDNKEIFHYSLSFAITDEFEFDSNTDVITATTICTNNNYISKMSIDNPSGDFSTHINIPGIAIKGIMHPRLPIFPKLNDYNKWNLISQLAVNKVLYSGRHGVSILKQTLEAYNFNNNTNFTRLINMICDIKIDSVAERLYQNKPLSIANGLAVTIIFSHEAAETFGYYLFCSVLEKYLGQYAPINTFIKTTTRIDGIDDSSLVWPKRAAENIWL